MSRPTPAVSAANPSGLRGRSAMQVALDRFAVAARVESAETAYPGDIPTFIEHVLGGDLWETQREIATAVQHHRRVAVRSCHASGKCVAASEFLTLADGTRLRAGDLAGKSFTLSTITEDGIQPVEARAEWNTVEPVFTLVTESGKRAVRNAAHPFWSATGVFPAGNRCKITPRGWVSLSDLSVGDLVAMTDTLTVTGKSPLPECEIKLLGYLIGDGGYTRTRVVFTQQNGPQLDEFRACVAEMGCNIHSVGRLGWAVTGAGERRLRQSASPSGVTSHPHNPIIDLLERHKLRGKHSRDKRIPAAIFTIPQEQVAVFLSRLFATDGWACTGKHKVAEIGFCSVSEGLVRDIQTLLLRFGITARIRAKRNVNAWSLVINACDDIIRFAEQIGIYGKETGVALAYAEALKKAQTRQRRVWRHKNAKEGTHWERIAAIEPAGVEATVAIAVPGHGHYLTEFWEHNSFLAARIAVAFLHIYPHSVVLSTAPTNNQVRNILWREIGATYRSARQPLLGRCLQMGIDIEPDWYGLGFKSEDTASDRFQGFHSAHVLVIIDEAAGVADTVFDALDAVMTSEDARMLLIGNPTNPVGAFHDAFSANAGLFYTIKVDAWSTPNFTAGRTVRPYLVTQQWVNDQIAKHGRDSGYVRARVDAEFPEMGEAGLIPLAWIEAANARRIEEPIAPAIAGVDVARFGGDETALCVRRGPKVEYETWWSGMDTMESAGRVRHELEPFGGTSVEIRIDEIGVGGGVADRLAELGYPVVMVNVATASSDKDKWPNLRHELWWQLRERFRLGAIAGPLDETAMGQAAAVRYTYDSRHTMPIIETKEAMKRRGLRSPDRAEAWMLAFADLPFVLEVPAVYAVGKTRLALRRS